MRCGNAPVTVAQRYLANSLVQNGQGPAAGAVHCYVILIALQSKGIG